MFTLKTNSFNAEQLIHLLKSNLPGDYEVDWFAMSSKPTIQFTMAINITRKIDNVEAGLEVYRAIAVFQCINGRVTLIPEAGVTREDIENIEDSLSGRKYFRHM